MTAKPTPLLVLTPGQLDAIEENLAAGLPLNKACGKEKVLAHISACLALAASDPAWAARMRAAESAGIAAVRARDEAMVPRLPKVGEAHKEGEGDGGGVVGTGDIGGIRTGLDSGALRGRESGHTLRSVDDVRPIPVDVGVGNDRAAPRHDVAEASGKRAAEHTDDGHPAPGQSPEFADAWAERRAIAHSLAPGKMGHLLWVERNCVDAGLHALDPLWLYHFEAFYASGKFLDVTRKGLRAGGSDSMCRALTAEVLLTERLLEPSLVGVCPIISSIMKEAGDRFATLKENLRANHVRELLGREEKCEGAYKPSGGGNQDYGIATYDSQGHPVEFRIYPARDGSVAGFTGIAGLGDELDLWGKMGSANPAARTVEVLVTRYTTQPSAVLHLISATYDRQSEHAKMIKKGDTLRQRVGRLGVAGAEVDYRARLRLAERFGLSDPLLLAPPDPMSTDISCWASNGNVAPIEDCYMKLDGDIRRMFATHGARPEFAGVGLCPLADTVFPVGAPVASYTDVAIGVAPPNQGEQAWGVVAVGISGGGLLAIEDASSDLDGQQAARTIRAGSVAFRAQVVVTASGQDKCVEAEIAAAYAGTGTPVAAVATIDVYDGGALRIGPLRTLYQRERLRHAPGLDALETEARAWHADAPRSPRLEALAVAVARLLACYPWLAAQTEREPLRGPAPGGTLLDRGEDPRESLRRAGAFVDRDDVL